MVKQYIIAPLCSAFLLPGLGQMLNRQYIKGAFFIAAVLALFLAFTIKVYLSLIEVLDKMVRTGFTFDRTTILDLLDKVKNQDSLTHLILIGLLFAVWLFSILDAYFYGRRQNPPLGEE